jgi:hypothetical protein
MHSEIRSLQILTFLYICGTCNPWGVSGSAFELMNVWNLTCKARRDLSDWCHAHHSQVLPTLGVTHILWRHVMKILLATPQTIATEGTGDGVLPDFVNIHFSGFRTFVIIHFSTVVSTLRDRFIHICAGARSWRVWHTLFRCSSDHSQFVTFLSTFQNLAVPLRTARFNIKKNSTCCLLRVGCFVRSSKQTAGFALYIINWYFYHRGGKCLQRGTDWLLRYSRFITVVESVYSAVRTDSLYVADL